MKTLVAALVAAVAAGGIAYAAIPDAAGVYHGCIHKNTGALRVIDSATQQCNANTERSITFNRQGPAGAAPTVAQLPSGDSHCAAGGAAITDAAGSTAYVCNGSNGADGDSFDGTFTSPNGQYALSVTDAGIALTSNAGVQVGIVGDDVAVQVDGDLDVVVGHNSQLSIGSNMQVAVGSGLTQSVGGPMSTYVGGDLLFDAARNLTTNVGKSATSTVAEAMSTNVGRETLFDVGRSFTLDTGTSATFQFGSGATFQSAGATAIRGSTVSLNGGSACQGVARIGDSVSPTTITSGSSTVCAGG